ncbi:hypothetical protein TNCV_2912351 [Trichonephila clavipes]|nr:hypothetical protein TNCV_2912351 [Trichonephila clavipes]
MAFVEQTTNTKFCVRLVKSATETYEMLKHVYGSDKLCAMSCIGISEKAGKVSKTTNTLNVHSLPAPLRTSAVIGKKRLQTIAQISESVKIALHYLLFALFFKPLLAHLCRNLSDALSYVGSLRTFTASDVFNTFPAFYKMPMPIIAFLKIHHYRTHALTFCKSSCIFSQANTKFDVPSLLNKRDFFQSPSTPCIRLQNTTPWKAINHVIWD